MKVIIAGAGESGTYLAQLLYDNKDSITIIDFDDARIKYIDEHYDFLSLKGSTLSIETLKTAGISDCDLFIAMTDTEEGNILSCIMAKKLGAKKVIARVSNKEYTDKFGQKLFEGLGIDSLVYPEILASEEIVNILEQAGTKQFVKFANGSLQLVVLRIKEGSHFSGMKFNDLKKDKNADHFRSIAIKRQGKTLIPSGNNKMQPDDLVFTICKKPTIDYLLKQSGNPSFTVKNVMIMGGSRIGYKTALALQKTHNVKLFERDKEKCHELSEILNNTLIINGDGRDTPLLTEEGIENTDAFIAVTGNSETNILACLHAKKFGVKKTIAEIENMDDLPLVQNMGVNSVINKKLIAAGHIYTHVLSQHLASVQCLSDIDAEILEFIVPEDAPITMANLNDLNFPEDAIIGGIMRANEKSIIPKGSSRIRTGDKVIVCAMPDAITKATDFFKKK
jgi:trk system potassium uptake protein TrkA